MRIITGSLKGRNVSVPSKTNIRPTTDRVKEGMFAVIDSRKYIEGCSVLDLFAGSGNLGFEALSRGANRALFVDCNQKCLKHLEKMAEEFDMQGRTNTMCLDIIDFLNGPPVPSDLIFADPPYPYRDVETIVELIFDQEWLAKRGWLVMEHNKYHHFKDHPHFLLEKKYGRSFVSFFVESS
jgi:16S rRNA (guanine(966)-N(2))-methyltransferase RsmD